MSTRDRVIALVYLLWAVVAISLALLVGGLSDDNLTRLLILGFLAAQLVGVRFVRGPLSRLRPRARFVASGLVLAAAVEGFYMISRPVFPSLRIGAETDVLTGIQSYAIDLALTLPAYVAILLAIWWCISRYRYTLWEYILIMGAGQMFGDGLFYFASAPAMLVFLPYPMTNYHAINIAPFLVTRGELPATARTSRRRFFALPLLVLVYLVCGAVISMVGSLTGLQ
jgi:hypothetical protein